MIYNNIIYIYIFIVCVCTVIWFRFAAGDLQIRWFLKSCKAFKQAGGSLGSQMSSMTCQLMSTFVNVKPDFTPDLFVQLAEVTIEVPDYHWGNLWVFDQPG